MKTYINKRLIQAVGVCLIISMISYFLLFLNTDPALLQPQLTTPLWLDESIHGPYFTRVARAMKACRIINIKQGRVGGIARSKKIDGTTSVPETPGLGVAVNKKTLDSYTIKKEVIRI